MRAAELVISRPPTLSDLMRQAERAEIPELNLIVKADVQGSLGALSDALLKLPQEEVRVQHRARRRRRHHRGRHLARAGVELHRDRVQRPARQASARARREGRRRRPPLPGDLRRDRRHQGRAVGHAEARAAGEAPGPRRGAGDVPGAEARRDRRVLRARRGTSRATAGRGSSATASWSTTGRSRSLRRFKDDVREVAAGYECGIGIENFQDIKEGDLIEAYEVREVARTI